MYYSEHKDKVKPHPKDPDNSDEGVEKVNHWLRAYYDSSESDLDMLPMCFRDDAFTRRRKGQGYHRPHKKNVNLYYQHPRAREIPVNWSFAPKFSGKFPSRLEECQGHAANCDRCLIANARMRNNHDISEQPIKYHNAHSGPTPVGVGHTRPDSKSLSSDSALGGSGERLWSAKDGRIPLLPAEEAEILQDLIQPDDSASGIPPGEPCPDYSTLTTDDQRTDESYNHELSNILKDFEGQLNAYDPDTTQRSGSYRKYITVGDF